MSVESKSKPKTGGVMMRAFFLSFFVSVCLVWGSVFAKTQIDVENLPEIQDRHHSNIHAWIDELESGGYLVNVPQDTIDFWRGAYRDHVRNIDIIKVIEAYNTVDAKSLAEVKAEFTLRGGPLSEDYYQDLLSLYRSHEQTGDDSYLDYLANYKAQLAFLSSLTAEQWGYLTSEDIRIFTNPGQGTDLENFKVMLGAYVPMIGVPTPVTGFASFHVFANSFEQTWPILVVVDNNQGAWDVEDEQRSYAKLQFKFVANDGTETILRTTEFGTSEYHNIERDMFYIPPQSGHLYYRYADFCVASNSNVRKDGDWSGGIAITHGHPVGNAELISRGQNPSPSIPMANFGNASWDMDAHFAKKEREYQAQSVRIDRLINEINPLRNRMYAELYPEDFNLLTGQKTYELDPNFAPQWALDAQATLKIFFGGDYVSVMYGARQRIEMERGYSRSAGATLSQQVIDYRAEIANKRAGLVEETSWEWEKRLNDELASAKAAGNQAEIDRLETALAAGYSSVSTNEQETQQQDQQVQGGQSVEVEEDSSEDSIYTQSSAFIVRLKKALKREGLFDKNEFKQLEKAIKDENMPRAFAKLNDYRDRGGQKVKKAVKNLRKLLKFLQALDS